MSGGEGGEGRGGGHSLVPLLYLRNLALGPDATRGANACDYHVLMICYGQMINTVTV